MSETLPERASATGPGKRHSLCATSEFPINFAESCSTLPTSNSVNRSNEL